MPVEWYFRTMGEVIGPLTAREIRLRALAGDIACDTLVTRAGADEWITADRVSGLLSAPADDELRALASSEARGQESVQTAQLSYLQNLTSASLELWKAFSPRERCIGVTIATGLLILVIAAINNDPQEFVPASSLERTNSASRESTSRPLVVDRETFYNSDRDPPFLANQRDGYRTRREAISALAAQFSATTSWVEDNMGSSNRLMDIHYNLARGKLSDASSSK